MSRKLFSGAVFTMAVLRYVLGQMDSCPSFGTDQSSRLSKSSEERIFMNFEAPSQCTGNVTSWRFCYYRNINDDFDEISNSRDFEAVFLIYRRESMTSDNYVTVVGSVREKALQWSVVQSSRFTCMDEVLSPEEYFEIQQNDIVGACIKDVGSDYPLLLVGTSSGSNFQTYQLDRRGYQDCTSVRTNIVDTSHSSFRQRSTSTLHLFANIAVANTCRAGNNPSPADAVTSSLGGTYFNVESPVTCNNHITKWHYCYHTGAATPGSTLSMTVAVWSLDTDTNAYIVSPSSIRTITLQPVQTLAKIFCVEESVDQSEFVQVSLGDVIGVVLPSSNAIPIISSSVDPLIAIKKHPRNESPVNLLQSDLSYLSSTALHLYATVVYRDVSTSPSITSTLSAPGRSEATSANIHSTSSPSTQHTMVPNEPVTMTQGNDGTTIEINLVEQNDQRGNFSGANIAAIFLSLLLVLVAVLLITIFVIYIRRRKRRHPSSCKPGFENVMYSASCVENKDGHVTLHHSNSIAEPYTYSEATMQRGNNETLQTCTVDYEFVEDYYTQMNCAYAYQQELEHIKRGSIANNEEKIYTDPGNNENEIYSFLTKKKIKNIPGNAIVIGSHLGSGHFGMVYQGEWKIASKEIMNVAIKGLKENATSHDRLKFLQEAATMAQFRHPNVVALYGVTSKSGKMMMVVELLIKGDLRQHLHTLLPDPGELIQSSTPNILLQFSQQICLGMNYLASTGFIHRDLAARNILISDSLMCKIADFGMSRDLLEGDYYTSRGGKIPLKWTAPEAIHYKKFSTASDVWSYGCVLYEIWSLGHKPFEEMGNFEVLRVVDTGGRIAPPPGCPERIYEIMMQCWSTYPKQRPRFRDILMSMLENESVVLHIPPDVTVSHPQAATLGAPLKAGLCMYSDMQKTYMSN